MMAMMVVVVMAMVVVVARLESDVGSKVKGDQGKM